MPKYLYQDRDTGRALPDDFETHRDPNWTAYIDENDPQPCRIRYWKPARNLTYRVRRAAEKNGVFLSRFEPVPQDIKDGVTFPSFIAHDVRDHRIHVTLVLDPDCEENVIYAYGPAIWDRAEFVAYLETIGPKK